MNEITTISIIVTIVILFSQALPTWSLLIDIIITVLVILAIITLSMNILKEPSSAKSLKDSCNPIVIPIPIHYGEK